MIDWIKSAELNNCTVGWLKSRFVRFPKSNKKIITNCNNCNEERKLNFCDYHGDDCDLCHSCSHNTPEMLEIKSKVIHQFYIDNPEARESARLKTIEQMKDPKAREYLRLKTIAQFANQIERDRLSKAIQNIHKTHPEIWNDANENMRGGNDIIMHHWLYDDADLSKYTMPMTRSEHMEMHNRMREDGYKVPHINSDTDDNGLWGYK